MSLLDDLRAAAHALDPQFQVSSNEVSGVLSSLVHYAQHGDEFLKAAEQGVEDLTGLLAPEPPKEQSDSSPAAPAPVADPAAPAPSTPVYEPAPPAPADQAVGPADAPAVGPVDPAAPGEDVSDEELDRQIADLEARRAARRATAQQTVVEHQAGDEPPVTHRPGWFHTGGSSTS